MECLSPHTLSFIPPPCLYLFIFLMWVLWVQYRFLPCITKCTCFKGGWGSDPRYTHMNACCHQQHHHPHLFRANKPSCFINPPSLIKNQPHFSQPPPLFLALFEERAPGSLGVSVPLSSFPLELMGHSATRYWFFFLFHPLIQSVIGVEKVIK